MERSKTKRRGDIWVSGTLQTEIGLKKKKVMEVWPQENKKRKQKQHEKNNCDFLYCFPHAPYCRNNFSA